MSDDSYPISKPTLSTLSRAIEQYAMNIGDGAVVLSTFQRSSYYAKSAHRYGALATAGVTTVAAYAGTEQRTPGVRSVVLADHDPLALEWATLLLSPSLSVFVGGTDLVALDESSLSVESGRRFLARLTFDHAAVVRHGERYLDQLGPSMDPGTAALLADAVEQCRNRQPSDNEIALSAATSVLVERLEKQQRTIAVTRDALLAETERADIDPLTGLLNRSGLERWLGVDPTDPGTTELPPFALIIVDLDDFKAVNDRFGHPCGDELLANVGIAVRSSVRPGDVVCRWGGDEFVVLCPGASDDDLASIGDRLVDAIAAVDVDGASVTASVGCQRTSRHPFPIDAADDALYRAKAAGGSTRVTTA
ncbi:MAG: diguanylate cyclase [Actinobacteria bacterium]|nr:diguanylate cyclase [Actinomycetota bacterium]